MREDIERYLLVAWRAGDLLVIYSTLGVGVRILDVGVGLASTGVRESGNVPTGVTIIDSGRGVTLSLLA